MVRPMIRALAWATAVLVAAAPLSAAIYVVHMKNGTTFETRYEPVDAPWDDGKIVFLDEWGTLIALNKAEIEDVESEVEASGFGHQLDNTTVAFGWAPNDAPAPGTQGAFNRAQAQAEAARAAPEASDGEDLIDEVNESPVMGTIYPVYTTESGGQGETIVPPVPDVGPDVEPPF
jgi:hypothetical protein